MKTKILKGIVMMSVVVLSACSSTQYAAQQKKDLNDDVYYSKAKAGEQVEYASGNSYRNDGYYDDYAGRINRFGYSSPFAYDSYMYSPYSSYGAAGLGLGLGYGLGGYYSPYSMYSPYSLYSPYSYYGTGYYGYGGSPYMGLYSGYSTANNSTYGARPNRGNGNPSATYRQPYTNSTLQRSSVARSYSPSSRNSSINRNNSNNGYTQQTPARQYAPQTQRSMPTYTAPAPSSMGGGFGGGGGGGRVSSSRPPRG